MRSTWMVLKVIAASCYLNEHKSLALDCFSDTSLDI